VAKELGQYQTLVSAVALAVLIPASSDSSDSSDYGRRDGHLSDTPTIRLRSQCDPL